jgi:hypothetical protein
MFGVALGRDTLRGPKKKGRKVFAQRMEKTKRVIRKGKGGTNVLTDKAG